MHSPSSVTILYGSETGNAQDYAELLHKKLQYYQLKPTLSTLDNYPLKKLVTNTDFLIVFCSTTGQGELPRNSKKFWKFLLKKKLPHDLFNHIKLTTFGLGDSSYPKYNHAVKKIHTRLMQLGCNELSPRCEADEISPEGIDGFFTEWLSELIPSLMNFFPDLKPLDDNVLLPAENPLVVESERDDLSSAFELDSLISVSRALNPHSGLSIGKISLNDRITTNDHFQDVRHVVINSSNLKYLPGDTLALYPSNTARSTELLLELQPHWIEFADKPLSINGKIPNIEGGFINLKHLTLRHLITYHLDIMSIPRRSFFMTLWHFTDDSTEDGAREKEKLQDFCKFEESEELYNYANRPRRLILETIMEFQKNTKIPIEYILDLFPTIKPRLFSIASRPSQNQVEIVVAIVEYKTMLRRIRRGLCTTWLKELETGDDIVFSIHKSNISFQLPGIPTPPILMISPGTGVAPMKSLIEHVTSADEQQQLYLFYGCRYQKKDYLFEDLWSKLCDQGKLELFPCFSRDTDSKIKYVQDNLFLKFQLVGDLLLNQNAIIFICGSSGNMPKQVRITLVEILVKFGGLEHERAEQYLLQMENSGRYIQETW